VLLGVLLVGEVGFPGYREPKIPTIWQLVISLPLVLVILVLLGPLCLLAMVMRGLTKCLKRVSNVDTDVGHDGRRDVLK
jgi:hypothetical protein